MSQYKSQLLSILDLMPSFPQNTIPMTSPAAIMLNILGGANEAAHLPLLKDAVGVPNANLHMYGKASKPARKIGHITVLGNTMAEAESAIAPLLETVNHIREERVNPSSSSSAVVPSPKASPYLGAPLVAVTMGSDSDLPVLKPGLAILRDFGVPFSVDITSAHRTPAIMTTFAETAAARGVKVIIAAAGGAAHLPGMVAASTSLPVIGVPVKGSTLDGMDSLLSIVQMPRGVPVASVAINNSVNAALLALRILGAGETRIREKMDEYREKIAGEVGQKRGTLEEVGWDKYEYKK
jgi:phosphoribosylaminoimidazole carboxylase